MLSRVAANIYWVARYLERAENTARMIGVNANLLLDLPKGVSPGWEPLITITGNDELFLSRYSGKKTRGRKPLNNKTPYGEKQVLKFLIGDRDNPGSIMASLYWARENCRTVRDIIPREAWEQLNTLYINAEQNMQSGLTKKGLQPYLDEVIEGVQLLTGLLAGTMNRDEAYCFLRMGRNLERADMTSRIIDVRSAGLLDDAPELPTLESIQWKSVLSSMSGYQMYRLSTQVRVRRTPVLQFLLQNAVFPRSIYYALTALENGLNFLERNEPSLRSLSKVKRKLLAVSTEKLDQEALHAFIDELQLGLHEIHEKISKTYFPG